MAAKAKQNKDVQITVRLEEALFEALKKEAEKDGRPLAGYIRHLLVTRNERLSKK